MTDLPTHSVGIWQYRKKTLKTLIAPFKHQRVLWESLPVFVASEGDTEESGRFTQLVLLLQTQVCVCVIQYKEFPPKAYTSTRTHTHTHTRCRRADAFDRIQVCRLRPGTAWDHHAAREPAKQNQPFHAKPPLVYVNANCCSCERGSPPCPLWQTFKRGKRPVKERRRRPMSSYFILFAVSAASPDEEENIPRRRRWRHVWHMK